MSAVLSTDKALPPDMTDELAVVMASMHLGKTDSYKFRNDICEGEISTRHKYVMIGTFGGIEYLCNIDFDDISAKVKMILREQGPDWTELN